MPQGEARGDPGNELKAQIQAWAGEVNKVLHDSAAGRMVSEWAKKQECWDAVRNNNYGQAIEHIPEMR